MISIIAAVSKNRVIGYKGKLPWHIKNDLIHFKNLTINKVVIMGRKTFESLNKPLPNRINVVISNTKIFKSDNVVTYNSLKSAIDDFVGKDIFIIGGENIFKEGLLYADKLYLTEIDKEYKGDRYFPLFNINEYDSYLEEEFFEDVSYRFMIYKKKSNR